MSSSFYNTTELNRMIAYLANIADKSTDEYRILNEYTELQKKRFADEDDGRPFISIITRTQGKRPEMLSEALLCICGQKDTDFELLVVGHNVGAEETKTVKTIIDDLPGWMREKTRYIPVEGGTRATPLNRGFEEAKGKYITIFDDDDLVFDNWIEEFRKCADKAPGKVLHCYAISQEWETLGGGMADTPVSADKPVDTFCKDFVLSNQLTFNVCPTMSLAFPAYTFKVLNIRFDEELSTTEDWDFLMRTAFVTGVFDSDVPTSIYRQWKNTENSKSLHNRKEWLDNYRNILDKYLSLPAFLGESSMSEAINPALNPGELLNAELFFSKGKAFNQRDNMAVTFNREEELPYSFSFTEIGYVKSIRIDPCDNGDTAFQNITVKVLLDSGEERQFTIDDIKSNGYRRGDWLCFLKGDPQLVIVFSKPVKVKKVSFNLDIIYPLPGNVLEEMLKKETSALSLFKRLFLKAKRVGRIFKR